jgi:hypothetical protein
MTLGSLLLFFALLIIVALIVVRPLSETAGDEAQKSDEILQWQAERERILDALAELDSDWQLEKIPKEIYADQRAQLVSKGASALRKIETLKRRNSGRRASNSNDELEELIAKYRRSAKK